MEEGDRQRSPSTRDGMPRLQQHMVQVVTGMNPDPACIESSDGQGESRGVLWCYRAVKQFSIQEMWRVIVCLVPWIR